MFLVQLAALPALQALTVLFALLLLVYILLEVVAAAFQFVPQATILLLQLLLTESILMSACLASLLVQPVLVLVPHALSALLDTSYLALPALLLATLDITQ